MPDMNESNDLTDEIAAKRQELADVRADREAAEASRLDEANRGAQQAEIDRLDAAIENEKNIQALLSGAGQEETPVVTPSPSPRPREQAGTPVENKEH